MKQVKKKATKKGQHKIKGESTVSTLDETVPVVDEPNPPNPPRPPKHIIGEP